MLPTFGTVPTTSKFDKSSEVWCEHYTSRIVQRFYSSSNLSTGSHKSLTWWHDSKPKLSTDLLHMNWEMQLCLPFQSILASWALCSTHARNISILKLGRVFTFVHYQLSRITQVHNLWLSRLHFPSRICFLVLSLRHSNLISLVRYDNPNHVLHSALFNASSCLVSFILALRLNKLGCKHRHSTTNRPAFQLGFHSSACCLPHIYKSSFRFRVSDFGLSSHALFTKLPNNCSVVVSPLRKPRLNKLGYRTSLIPIFYPDYEFLISVFRIMFSLQVCPTTLQF